MLEVTSSNEEQVPITASPVSSSGKPARFDGALRITVQSGNSTFTQDPATPNAFNVVSEDAPGVTDYLVEGDADLGSGVTLIQEVVRYTVTGANAAAFGLVGGTAIPK